jgi:hypothetical protein
MTRLAQEPIAGPALERLMARAHAARQARKAQENA